MVDLPNNKSWFDFANWISRGFFDDCLEVIQDRNELLSLRNRIQDAIKMHTFLLDLSKATKTEIFQFDQLVTDVIALNERRGAEHFNQPEFFNVYMQKLNDLKGIVNEDSILR